MGGIATPPISMAPAINPILAEIDAAHAKLSPDAQSAIQKAHGIAAPALTVGPMVEPLPPVSKGGPSSWIPPEFNDLLPWAQNEWNSREADRQSKRQPGLMLRSSGEPEPSVSSTFTPTGIAAPNGPPLEPPPGGGIQAPAPTTVGSGIKPPGAASPKLVNADAIPGVSGPSQDAASDNVSSAAIKPAGALAIPSLGSKMPVTTPTPIGGKVSTELARLTAPDTHQHDAQNTGTPGVNQIHNPWARVPLQILDALGRGFFPGVEMALPGTSGHHDVLVHQRQVEDTAEQNAAKAQTEEELQRAQAAHANAEAETAGQNNKQGLIKVGPGEGIYDPKTKTWVEEPTSTQLKNVTEVDPEIGKTIGIKPTADGRYLVPNTALGDLVKAKIPVPKTTEPKEGETPIGDERAASTSASLAAQYKEAGIPLPSYATLNGKHTQKDEARIVGLAKDEIGAHRTNQEFKQRELDRQAQFAAANSARTDTQLNHGWDKFNADFKKELEPVQSQLENVQEARRLINAGAEGQALGAIKTLVAVAGGKGTGVRITQSELNSIPSARSVGGDVQAFIQKFDTGKKMTPDQVHQVNTILGEVEALALAKQERANKYLDMGVSAKSPAEFRAIEQQYRHDQQQSNVSNSGGGAFKAGDTQVKNGVTYVRDDKGVWYPK